ncbi:phytanoyl-CoA dioxygenase family protein [Vibrio lentus]|uniref:phytanoyl-CoA dioxygenase family protein n=1 Tax=Vibrio lentus TaxID=136468 RepID=UPI000C851D05|nr:phytanoyl-CoA dioxygenase family protein [Vibrio lentus]MCC4783971.1 phytanoyl-CoA dioxygenase family protein [Vibrio lentus]MCC4854266.1 phytanoyl-CoA dioxygenase family protein [Vibrio lentus]PME62468.1 hypothetical protein BCV33_03875 [Vibrio lentus]PMG56723.1 hypothetical protein BCU87_22880 [Vibrio lentus]PMI94087.1 hypothetical protein BCU33_20070 [Vibrio lentus]
MEALKMEMSSFDNNGYLLLEELFSDYEIKSLKRAYNLDMRDSSFQKIHRCKSLDWVHSPSNVENYIEKRRDLLNEIKSIGCLLLGNDKDYVRLGIRIFNKSPDALGTNWHQDAAYIKERKNMRLNLWIPLDDVSKSNGTLRYIKGSHKQGLVPHHEDKNDASGSTIYIPGIVPSDSTTIDVKSGDAIIHHDLVIHSSHANNSQSVRQAIVIVIDSLPSQT